MKIVSLNIVAFGKLKNINLQFKDGLNVLQNSNGFGKTTLASFIRAMLYGFTYRQVNGIKDVSRYAPWGSTQKFGGSMMVEHDGVTYRIERFFGATARQESVKFTNEKTGKEINIETQPGEFLLGLTADSYDRSAYFPQEAVELSSNDNFDARLANLVQNSAEDYDKVQDKLRNYKKNLRYERGNGGKIYELDCEKQRLSQQLVNAEIAKRRSAEIDNRLHEIANEKAILSNRQAEYRDKLAKLQQQVAQTQLTDEDRRIRARLYELDEKLSRIPADFDADFARCDALSNEIAQIAEHKPPQKRKLNTFIKIGAAVLMLAAIILIVLGMLNVYSLPLGLALGGVCEVVGWVIIIPSIKKNKKVSKQPNSNKRDELLAQYLTIARKYVYADGVDYEAVKRALWEAHSGYHGDSREREALLPLLRQPKAEEANLPEQIDSVNNVLTEITQTVNDLSTEAGRLTEERKSLVIDSVAIQDRILSVDEQRKQAEHQYMVADYVSKLLEQAKDNLSSSYLPRLCVRTSELLREVAQSDLSVAVDRNFTVSIRENGQTKPMSEFSRGIREITLLCFRVALSELLYDGAIPFVIIDDALVNFDEGNFLRATTLLKKLAMSAQVIYFTCHNRMGNLLI